MSNKNKTTNPNTPCYTHVLFTAENELGILKKGGTLDMAVNGIIKLHSVGQYLHKQNFYNWFHKRDSTVL